MKCPLKHLGTSSSLIQREEFHVFIVAVINGSVLDRRFYFFNSKPAYVRHKQLKIQVLLILYDCFIVGKV